MERYQIDLPKVADLNQQDMQQKTTALCAAEIPGDTYRNLNVNADYQGRTFKHVLVPVWLLTYTYGSKNFQVLANGYSGTLAGEYPKSWIKIFVTAMLVLFVVMILIVAGGNN